MRYLKGGSLRTRLNNEGLSLLQVAEVLTQIASALTYSHRHGVIHRDIKRENIFADDEGNFYLGD